MTTHGAENVGPTASRRSHESLDLQVRRRGLPAVTSVADMARVDVFESDEELDEFIACVYAQRQSNLT